MTRKQLILHVGFHKSGTTALQESFFAQRADLKKQGILYPSVGWQAHHRVAWAIANKRWGWKDRGGKTASPANWIRMRLRILLSKEQKIVLSSEFLSELPLEKIQKLNEQVKTRQVKVLFTIRPLVKLLASSYQQYLKYGLKEDYVTWLHSVLDTPGKSKFNPSFWKRNMHGDVIRKWAEVFGAENVTLVIVDEKHPELLFESVNEYLGLPKDFLRSQPEGSNRSLSVEELALLLEINRTFPKERNWTEYLTFIRNGYVRHLTDMVPVGPNQEKLPTPVWAIEKGNEIARAEKLKIQKLSVQVFGDINTLDSAGAPVGEPHYPDSIQIKTVAQAMLVFNSSSARKFPISWLIYGLRKQLAKGLRIFKI